MDESHEHKANARQARGTALLDRFASKRAMLPAALMLVAMALALSLLYGNLQRDLGEADRLEHVMHHSIEVREGLTNLVEAHLDIQMGIGGYVFTGNPEFLGRYREAVERVQPALDRVSRLAANGQPPASDMPVLLSIVQDRVTNSHELAALMEAGRQADAQALIASTSTTAPMARLRRLVEVMDAEALARFEQARTMSSAVRVRIDQTLNAMLACLGVLLTVGGVTCLLIVRSKDDQIEYTEALINSVIDPIFVLDEDGVVLLTNTTAETRFAYSGYQFQGTSAGVILADPMNEEKLFRILKQLANSEAGGVVSELLFRRRNGTCFQGNVSISISKYTDTLRFILVIRPNLGSGAAPKATKTEHAPPVDRALEKSQAKVTV